MKHIISSICFLLMMSITDVYSQECFNPLIKTGIDFYNKHKYIEAQNQFNAANICDDKIVDTLNLWLQKNENALKYIKEHNLESKQDEYELLFQLGESAFKMEDYERTILLFQQLLSLSSQYNPYFDNYRDNAAKVHIQKCDSIFNIYKKALIQSQHLIYIGDSLFLIGKTKKKNIGFLFQSYSAYDSAHKKFAQSIVSSIRMDSVVQYLDNIVKYNPFYISKLADIHISRKEEDIANSYIIKLSKRNAYRDYDNCSNRFQELYKQKNRYRFPVREIYFSYYPINNFTIHQPKWERIKYVIPNKNTYFSVDYSETSQFLIGVNYLNNQNFTLSQEIGFLKSNNFRTYTRINAWNQSQNDTILIKSDPGYWYFYDNDSVYVPVNSPNLTDGGSIQYYTKSLLKYRIELLNNQSFLIFPYIGIGTSIYYRPKYVFSEVEFSWRRNNLDILLGLQGIKQISGRHKLSIDFRFDQSIFSEVRKSYSSHIYGNTFYLPVYQSLFNVGFGYILQLK